MMMRIGIYQDIKRWLSSRSTKMFGEDRKITSAAIFLVLVTATGSLIAGALVTKPEPEFEVDNLTVSSSKAVPGEKVTISVDVKNVGRKVGAHTVELKVDGKIVNSQTITLSGGEEKSVSFTLHREKKKSYSIELGNLAGTFSVVEPPEFEVSDLSITSRPSSESKLETITLDDLEHWPPLNKNLSLKGSADYEYLESRINLTDARPSLGVVLDSAFSNTMKNWEWKGKTKIVGGGSLHVIFYADGETLSGADDTQEVRNGYCLRFIRNENEIRLEKIENGETITFDSEVYGFGKEQHFRIKFEKGTVKTYINGDEELSYRIKQPDYRYDGFTVTGLSSSNFDHVYLLEYRLSRIRHLRIYDISANVSNVGGKSGAYEAELEINGEVENTKTVKLDAGESKDVSFSTFKSEKGIYKVGIENLTDTFEVD